MLTFALLSIAVDQWAVPTPYTVTHEVGYATYMKPGLMEQVVANRGILLGGRLPVVLNRAGDIGRVVWVQWADGDIERAIVVDCAQAGTHYRTRVGQDRILEVSAETAEEHSFYGVGPVPVRVWFQHPASTRVKRHVPH